MQALGLSQLAAPTAQPWWHFAILNAADIAFTMQQKD